MIKLHSEKVSSAVNYTNNFELIFIAQLQPDYSVCTELGPKSI